MGGKQWKTGAVVRYCKKWEFLSPHICHTVSQTAFFIQENFSCARGDAIATLNFNERELKMAEERTKVPLFFFYDDGLFRTSFSGMGVRPFQGGREEIAISIHFHTFPSSCATQWFSREEEEGDDDDWTISCHFRAMKKRKHFAFPRKKMKILFVAPAFSGIHCNTSHSGN